jgi:plastocyanin
MVTWHSEPRYPPDGKPGSFHPTGAALRTEDGNDAERGQTMKGTRLARRRPVGRGVALLVVFGLVLAGCGGGDDEGATSETTTATTAAANTVTISGFTFKPTPLEVKAGTAVTWTNKDEILHTVTSGAPGMADGKFSGMLDGKGKTFSFTFDQPGTFKYFCERHNSMTGEIVVS